ncbi:MAG: DM13 domain-containing protein [Chloroflexi bacterium]|nr:DM13 domain-containing protein [Chloroflexota bacterium]MQC28077.1 hypothetical protein [Chloroflexota bacterium]
MTATTLLMPERADGLRRMLLGAAAVIGVGVGAYILSDQAVADFLREGPARLLGIEGDGLRLLLAAGATFASLVAVAALWRGATLAGLVIAGTALGVGFLLVHVLLSPTLGLVALAVVADRSGRVTRARIEAVGPRRYPLAWGVGAVAGVMGVVGLGIVSLVLAAPLFDEGTRLEERLGFQVAGLVEPTAGIEPASASGAGDATPAPAAAATTDGDDDGDAAPLGELIATGDLEGADAFHTASGEVLLVRGPDGRVILRFQDYAVRNGPDLYIYLTPDPGGDVHAEGAIEVSAIKATNGFVNYEVPGDVDPTSFRTVVIYCRPFSVTFATAQLQ